MITGNAIHWIEQEGTCDDGVIKKAIDNLFDSLDSMGGWIVNSTEDILKWLRVKQEEDKNKPNKKIQK